MLILETSQLLASALGSPSAQSSVRPDPQQQYRCFVVCREHSPHTTAVGALGELVRGHWCVCSVRERDRERQRDRETKLACLRACSADERTGPDQPRGSGRHITPRCNRTVACHCLLSPEQHILGREWARVHIAELSCVRNFNLLVGDGGGGLSYLFFCMFNACRG